MPGADSLELQFPTDSVLEDWWGAGKVFTGGGGGLLNLFGKNFPKCSAENRPERKIRSSSEIGGCLYARAVRSHILETTTARNPLNEAARASTEEVEMGN